MPTPAGRLDRREEQWSKMRPMALLVLAPAAAAALVATACRSVSEPAPPAAGAAPPPVTATPTPPPPTPTPTPPHLQPTATDTAVTAFEETPTEPPSPQQEALESCQSASEFLALGDEENAIAALDRAYALMLTLPDEDDDNLQAKEDIRRLVANLLQQVYGSRRPGRPMAPMDLAIPVVENEYVRREIASFTNGERAQFLEAYARSGLYRPMIVAKLEAAGLPTQLSWLPMVESWFKSRALSRASALGMWQFIASTGTRYGLTRDGWVDERMDPEKATDAAIAYLGELHGLFGDWYKALAAYNCGEVLVDRLSRRSGEYQDFWDLYTLLPTETRRYVPRFLATLLIVENPAAYGMTLPEPLPPLADLATIRVEKAVQLAALDRLLGLEQGTLAELNPALRHGATPPRPYDLKVPRDKGELLVASLSQLPEWKPPQPLTTTHRVRRGETLGAIARQYHTSVEAIIRANRLRSAHRIWPGQRLEIPIRGERPAPAASAAPVRQAPLAGGAYTVAPGDTLFSIAQRCGSTVAELKQLNGLASDRLHPGQRLTLPTRTAPTDRRYQVQPGDTLASIATTARVSLEALLKANGLSEGATIYPGQWLSLPAAP
jgi:membrane-bound lytic murein transglycosylase D